MSFYRWIFFLMTFFLQWICLDSNIQIDFRKVPWVEFLIPSGAWKHLVKKMMLEACDLSYALLSSHLILFCKKI